MTLNEQTPKVINWQTYRQKQWIKHETLLCIDAFLHQEISHTNHILGV